MNTPKLTASLIACNLGLGLGTNGLGLEREILATHPPGDDPAHNHASDKPEENSYRHHNTQAYVRHHRPFRIGVVRLARPTDISLGDGH